MYTSTHRGGGGNFVKVHPGKVLCDGMPLYISYCAEISMEQREFLWTPAQSRKVANSLYRNICELLWNFMRFYDRFRWIGLMVNKHGADIKTYRKIACWSNNVVSVLSNLVPTAPIKLITLGTVLILIVMDKLFWKLDDFVTKIHCRSNKKAKLYRFFFLERWSL